MENPSFDTAASTSLSPQEIETFWNEGFLTVNGLFSHEEVDAWKQECERLWSMPGLVDPLNIRVEMRTHSQHGLIPDRLDPVLDLSPQLENLARDPRILAVLESLLKTSANLLRCKLIRKAAGTKGYDMHQDFPYWEWIGVPADDLLTVAIAIDPADEASGAIELFPGLHHGRLPAPEHEPRDVDETKIDLTSGRRCALNPGDILVFHSLAPHRSAPNNSAQNRTLLLPTYVSGRHGPKYKSYNDWFVRRKGRNINDFDSIFIQ